MFFITNFLLSISVFYVCCDDGTAILFPFIVSVFDLSSEQGNIFPIDFDLFFDVWTNRFVSLKVNNHP